MSNKKGVAIPVLGTLLIIIGIIAFAILGTFGGEFLRSSTEKAGKVISLVNFVESLRKMADESLGIVARRTAYDLGKTGGVKGPDIAVWTGSYPRIKDLKEVLENEVEQRIPHTAIKNDIEVDWNNKISIDIGKTDIVTDIKAFLIKGYRNFSAYDASINSKISVNQNFGRPIGSSYFKLLLAGRKILEDATYYSLLTTNTAGLEAAIDADFNIEASIKDSGDYWDISLKDTSCTVIVSSSPRPSSVRVSHSVSSTPINSSFSFNVSAGNPCLGSTQPTQCAYVDIGSAPQFVKDTITAQGGDPSSNCGNVLILSTGNPLDTALPGQDLSIDMVHVGCGPNPDGKNTYDCEILNAYNPGNDSVVVAISSEWPEFLGSDYTDWMQIGGIVDMSINSWPGQPSLVELTYGPAGSATVTLATIAASQSVDLRVADSGDYVYDTAMIVVPLSCFIKPPKPILCGNGILDPGEICDPGNVTAGIPANDAACLGKCTSLCLCGSPPAPVCGNGIPEAGEECDDGNLIDGDGCSSTCKIEEIFKTNELYCLAPQRKGEATIILGGKTIPYDYLQLNFRIKKGTPLASTYCGNSFIDPGEQCDDGNLGGETCLSRGYTGGGNLKCVNSGLPSECKFDESGCKMNQPPTADARVGNHPNPTDKSVTVNVSDTVYFDGSTYSSDPDGISPPGINGIVKWEWDFDGDGTYDWSSNVNGITTHVYTAKGTYIARLRVTDNDGATDTDQVTIIVTKPNQPPIADARVGNHPNPTDKSVTVNVSDTVYFDGSTYSSDPDGTLVKWEWDFTDDGIYEWSSNVNGITTWTYSAPGTYVARLRVTDNNGATDTDIVTIIVTTSVMKCSKYAIDGDLSDWGLDISKNWKMNDTWLPNDGVQFVAEDNRNPNYSVSYTGVHIKGVGKSYTFYDEKPHVYPGLTAIEPYGDEAYDEEAFYFDQDNDCIYVAFVISQSPPDSGDLAMNFDNDKTTGGWGYEYGIKLLSGSLPQFGLFSMPAWKATGILENSPYSFTSGNYIGQVSGAYVDANVWDAGPDSIDYRNYIVEIAIPKAMVGSPHPNIDNFHLTMWCGNDVVPVGPNDTLIALISSPKDGYTFIVGEPITFDSLTSGGTPPYTYSWVSSIDGIIGNTKSFSKSDLSVGDHTITLTVTDNVGATVKDTILIHVIHGSLTAKITSPKDGDTFGSGDSITFDSLTSGGTPPYGYVWTSSIDGNIANTKTFAKNNLAVGDHKITLTVTDNVGATATDQITIHILTASFDWSHKVLPAALPSAPGDWMTPIKNQGLCGSCWAFSPIGAVESKWDIQNNNPTLDINLSEQYLVSCSGVGSCSGGSPYAALDYIKNNGVVDESCLPYSLFGLPVSCSNKCIDWNTRLWKISNWNWVPDNRADIKQYLISKGPLVAVMNMTTWNPITYDCPPSTTGVDHGVVIEGYDDAEGVWIVRNSWGSGWNGNGYFKVKYGACSIEEYSPAYVENVINP